jgi:hypothetical protein
MDQEGERVADGGGPPTEGRSVRLLRAQGIGGVDARGAVGRIEAGDDADRQGRGEVGPHAGGWNERLPAAGDGDGVGGECPVLHPR